MTKLTREQKIFLNFHKIDERFIFDATGIRHKDYGKIMKDIGLFFTIGVTPCQKSGHTLRNRKGQCIQCNTANIAFMLRSGKNAYIYVVGSIKGQVLKVGFTKDVNDRIEHLVGDKYGGLNDWKILYSGKYDNALKFESLIHNSLSKVHYNIEYNYYGKDIICNELFRCSFQKIKNIINENKYQFGKVSNEFISDNDNDIDKYNFGEESKNIVNKSTMKDKLKLCPYCSEKIQKNAIKCKHCCEWLDDNNKDDEIQKIKEDLKESEQTVSAYSDALDTLGEHEILGPLNEKLLRGEELNIEEYFKKSNQKELIDINIDVRDKYIRYVGIISLLRDNGFISIKICNIHKGIIIKCIKNKDFHTLNKYEELDKIINLKYDGFLEEEEFIIKLNKFIKKIYSSM